MASDDKTHWPTAFTLYFLVGLFLDAGAVLVRVHSPRIALSELGTGTIAVVFIAALVPLVLWLINRRMAGSIVGSASRFLLRMFTRFWHVGLAWLGTGLWTFAIAEVIDKVSLGGVVSAMFAGPLAFASYPNAFLIEVVFIVLTLLFVLGMYDTKIANHKGGKGSVVAVYRNTRKTVTKGAEWAPATEPDDAHFAETTKELSHYLIDKKDLPNRVSFGTTKVASDWGKKRRSVEIGLPDEGSAVLIGSPGSGKTLLGHRMILNIERASKDVMPTKLVVFSVKPRDIAGVVTPYLRSLGMPVKMWDLTAATKGDRAYGDPVRWSPKDSSTDYGKATQMAKRIVESAREPGRQNDSDFWDKQNTIAIAAPLLAANLRGSQASYETAIRWAQRWDDPNETDVEAVLSAHGNESGAADALQDWVGLRSSVLDRLPTGVWVKRAQGDQANVTGDNIRRTLSGIMTEIARQEVYDATANASLNARAWVRDEGSAALFLIGNMRMKGMTRSLFAPAVEELIAEAMEYAAEQEEGRLPYRLVIFADELANLAPIKDLQEIYSTARSARISVIAVFQSYAQAEQVYGATVARILLDASAAIVVLAGVNDPDLIRDLNTIGGSKQVTLNGDTITTHPLIEGQHLLALRKPDPTNGDPGTALMVMASAVAKIDIPIWTTEYRYDDRGTVLPQHKAVTETLRKKRSPWPAYRRDALAWFKRRATHLTPDTTDGNTPTATPDAQSDADEAADTTATVSADANPTPDATVGNTPTISPDADGPLVDARIGRPLVRRAQDRAGLTGDSALMQQSGDVSPLARQLVPHDTDASRAELVEEPQGSGPGEDDVTGELLDVLQLDDAGETFISATDGARTYVPVAGHGDKAWLARLLSQGGRYGFNREFIDSNKVGLRGPSKTGVLIWPGPLTDGVYEWRSFCISTGENWQSSGFALVSNGKVSKITKEQAVRYLPKS